jgi:hypothetical protein
MAKLKFDETDRQKVIEAVESHFKVKLTPVGNRRKFLRDDTMRSYWVFGGYEDWHGIPAEMLDAEIRNNTDGILVVAKRGLRKIEIYAGRLSPLVKNKNLLSLTKKGEYQFNVRTRGERLTILEVPEVSLHKIEAAEYPVREKESEKATAALKDAVRRMTPEQKAELLKELLKNR